MIITLCIIAFLIGGEITGARAYLARLLEKARAGYEARP